MRLNKNITPWLALAVAALLAATAVADDRNFLRQLNAPPNLIFVLDTSVILYDFNALNCFDEHDVVIPITVEEHQKRIQGQQPPAGAVAEG